MSPRRILDAVTPRRVIAFLLIGGFAKEILSVLTWLAGVGWDLKDVATLRALALAGVRFALDAALIYGALRGLRSVLDRRRRHRGSPFAEDGVGEEHHRSGGLEDLGASGSEAAGRPREGGADGRGPGRR